MRKKEINVNNEGNEDLYRDIPDYQQILEVDIPVPPSVNHMYQNAGRGKRLTKEATQYIKTVQETCKKEMKKIGWKHDKPNVWYVMDLYYFFPDKKVRDSHNTLKILTDSMEGLVFPNDYYVLPRIQYVTLDRKNPMLHIKVYPQNKAEIKRMENICGEIKRKVMN